jgi:hypothetical protein
MRRGPRRAFIGPWTFDHDRNTPHQDPRKTKAQPLVRSVGALRAIVVGLTLLSLSGMAAHAGTHVQNSSAPLAAAAAAVATSSAMAPTDTWFFRSRPQRFAKSHHNSRATKQGYGPKRMVQRSGRRAGNFVHGCHESQQDQQVRVTDLRSAPVIATGTREFVRDSVDHDMREKRFPRKVSCPSS